MNPAPRTVRRSLPWLLAALSMIGASLLPLGGWHGIGVQLAFSTLTLLLDRFPHHRGGISSVQAFCQPAAVQLRGPG